MATYELHPIGCIAVTRNDNKEILLTAEQVDFLREFVNMAQHVWDKYCVLFHLPKCKGKKKLAQRKRFYIMVFKEIMGTRQIRVQDVRMTYKLLGITISPVFIRRTLRSMKYLRNRYGFTREKKPYKKLPRHRSPIPEYLDEQSDE